MSKIKSDLPLIPLRDVVVFPGIVTTLFVGRAKSVEALNIAMTSNKKLVRNLLLVLGRGALDSFAHVV